MGITDTVKRECALMALVLMCVFTLAFMAGCAANGQSSGSSSQASGRPTSKGEVIGIIGAMDAEVNSLKTAAESKSSTEIAGMEFCEGTIGEKHVVIVKCGMGKVNAGICAHTLINHFGCTKIINTGVAGSLDNRVDIGNIVVSTDAVQHDFDVTHIGFAQGEIPYTGLSAFPADEGLRSVAVNAVREADPSVRVFEGRVCSGDQFINTKEQRDAITSKFGGLCCEMEGAAVAQTCYLNNVPFVVIRAISDKPNETMVEDYRVFEGKAAALCAALVEYMIGNI